MLAPGNSIGTLTVGGDLAFGAGSIYRVEVSPSAADRARASRSLTGGTVQTSFLPGTYVRKSYTILSLAGGLGGTTFSGVRHPAVGLSYTLSDVLLQSHGLARRRQRGAGAERGREVQQHIRQHVAQAGIKIRQPAHATETGAAEAAGRRQDGVVLADIAARLEDRLHGGASERCGACDIGAVGADAETSTR